MKKVILVLGFVAGSLNLFAQSESATADKRLKLGFNVGTNYSNVYTQEDLPANADLSNNIGLRLGILADYKLLNFLSVAPKVEMSFNNGRVQFSDPAQNEYKIMPIGVDFITHFIFKKENERLSPYLLIGPNFRLPITKKIDNPTVYPTSHDFAIDVGIGLEKPFTHFSISPEVRYSYGLLDVNQHPGIQSLRFHNISLVLNFVG